MAYNIEDMRKELQNVNILETSIGNKMKAYPEVKTQNRAERELLHQGYSPDITRKEIFSRNKSKDEVLSDVLCMIKLMVLNGANVNRILNNSQNFTDEAYKIIKNLCEKYAIQPKGSKCGPKDITLPRVLMAFPEYACAYVHIHGGNPVSPSVITLQAFATLIPRTSDGRFSVIKRAHLLCMHELSCTIKPPYKLMSKLNKYEEINRFFTLANNNSSVSNLRRFEWLIYFEIIEGITLADFEKRKKEFPKTKPSPEKEETVDEMTDSIDVSVNEKVEIIKGISLPDFETKKKDLKECQTEFAKSEPTGTSVLSPPVEEPFGSGPSFPEKEEKIVDEISFINSLDFKVNDKVKKLSNKFLSMFREAIKAEALYQ